MNPIIPDVILNDKVRIHPQVKYKYILQSVNLKNLKVNKNYLFI